MKNQFSIKYKQIWANMSIVIGMFCVFIFLAGAYLLKDITILMYVLAALVPIYVGFKMRKSNYALVSKNRIQVFGLLGNIKNDYKLNKNEKFRTINNRIYLKRNKVNLKVKMNNWFVNQHDWNRVLEFFSDNENDNIIKHLTAD
tara:strand:+ start:139 stop:570 length:432 start_codon:yes stop_codon:yes gene_type:complete